MKHKHYDMIVAWASGAKIQIEETDGTWSDIEGPSWYGHNHYRIKPEPKPDFCTYSTIMFGNTGIQSTMRYGTDNVKFTYDGESRKLKSAEVLK
jgi:hypothetical protein